MLACSCRRWRSCRSLFPGCCSFWFRRMWGLTRNLLGSCRQLPSIGPGRSLRWVGLAKIRPDLWHQRNRHWYCTRLWRKSILLVTPAMPNRTKPDTICLYSGLNQYSSRSYTKGKYQTTSNLQPNSQGLPPQTSQSVSHNATFFVCFCILKL